MDNPKLKVISLGWGVQSWALAAMSALGVLPKVDFAIHSDTTYERAETYAFAQKWTPWLEERGICVVTVRAKPKTTGAIFDNTNTVYVPLFTRDNVTGKKGKLLRTCTHRWKIVPLRRWVSAHLKSTGLKKQPGTVEQWLGITLDEIERAKPSKVKYIVNTYPFLSELITPWTREMVVDWLISEGLGVPVKSACYFCPFHNLAAWHDINQSDTGDWERAIEADRAIRGKRPGFLSYFAQDTVPLDELDFSALNSASGVGDGVDEMDECDGGCFL